MFLNFLLNKIMKKLLINKIKNPIYPYKVDDDILNKLNFSDYYFKHFGFNLTIFVYLMELLYDIFEGCSTDSTFIENNEKGILGNTENVITEEIIMEYIELKVKMILN